MHTETETAARKKRRIPPPLPASERLQHSIRKSAEILDCSQRKVWRLIAEGKLKSTRPKIAPGQDRGRGQKRYIAHAELEAYVAREHGI